MRQRAASGEQDSPGRCPRGAGGPGLTEGRRRREVAGGGKREVPKAVRSPPVRWVSAEGRLRRGQRAASAPPGLQTIPVSNWRADGPSPHPEHGRSRAPPGAKTGPHPPKRADAPRSPPDATTGYPFPTWRARGLLVLTRCDNGFRPPKDARTPLVIPPAACVRVNCRKRPR